MMDPIRYHSTEELRRLVKQDGKNNLILLQRLKKMKQPETDQLFHSRHTKAFDQFDCLGCANCCSSISPIITVSDIDKLARHFKQKATVIIDKYLHIDEDGDYVFNETPCPFLMPDNYCMVYENRPKACREYPHTDRRKMQQILKLTLKNCEICPIVYHIVEDLKDNLFNH